MNEQKKISIIEWYKMVGIDPEMEVPAQAAIGLAECFIKQTVLQEALKNANEFLY